MMRALAVVAALAAVLSQQPPPAQAQSGIALTNADIVRMVEAGLSPDVIAGAVRQATTTSFTLTPDALIELKKKGVPDMVIGAMLSSAASSPAVTSGPFAASPPANSSDPMQAHAAGIYLDAGEQASLRLVPLTEATVTGQSASGGWTNAFTAGLTKMKANYQVREIRAEHRTTNPVPTFYAYGVDPQDYALLKMKVKAKDREREFTGMVLGFTGSRAPKGDIEISAEKVAEGIFRVKPTSPLQPGEYCFAYATRGVALAALDFGVDAPSASR